MDQQDQQVGKITPVIMEVASPVTEHLINNGAKIKLGAMSIKHGTSVDAGGGKSCLVNLKHVSTFGWFHG